MSLITFVVLLCCLGASSSDLLSEDGILVIKEGRTKTVSAIWKVVVVLHAPSPPNIESLMNIYNKYREEVDYHMSQAEKYIWDKRLAHIEHSLEVGAGRISDELVVRRSKRGLVNVFGWLGKKLFGLATSSDVEHISKAVTALQFRTERLIDHDQYLLTVINASREYIKENRDDINSIKDQTNELSVLVGHLQQTVNSHGNAIRLLQLTNIIDQTLTLMEVITNSYVALATDYHQKRVHLDRDYLNRDILPPSQLAMIKEKLISGGHEVLQDSWYYHNIPIIPIWETLNGQVAYRVDIPAVNREVFLTYSLQYFPMLFNTEYVRQFNGETNIAVSSETGISFIPDKSVCIGGSLQICYPPIQYSHHGCESDLVLGKGASSCNVTISPKPNQSSLLFRSQDFRTFRVLAFEEVKITKRCAGIGPKTFEIVGMHLFSMEDMCSYESKNWLIKGVEIGQDQLNITYEKPLLIPALNFTWPTKLNPLITSQLKMHRRVTIPLIEVPNWEEHDVYTPEDHDILKYVTLGLSVLGVLIGVAFKVFLVYYRGFCCAHKKVPSNDKDESDTEDNENPEENRLHSDTHSNKHASFYLTSDSMLSNLNAV